MSVPSPESQPRISVRCSRLEAKGGGYWERTRESGRSKSTVRCIILDEIALDSLFYFETSCSNFLI